MNYQTIIAKTEVSNAAILYFLKTLSLKVPVLDRASLQKFIEENVNSGNLQADVFCNGIRDIEEHGGKEVYLRKIDDLKLLKDTKAMTDHLIENDLKISQAPLDTRRRPSGRAVFNYATLTDDDVRIKFTETHVHLKRIGRKVEESEKTKCITFSVNRKTGFALIILDHAGHQLRGSSEESSLTHNQYFDEYLTKFTTYFGISEPFVFSAGMRFAFGNAEDQIELLNASAPDDEGVEAKFSRRKDLRKTKSYSRIAKSDLEKGYVIWKRNRKGDGDEPEKRSEEKPKSFIRHNPLSRDIKVYVYPVEGRLSFRTEVLSQELLYVISTIRAAQNKSSALQSTE